MKLAFCAGNALLTVATGEMSKQEAERAGLVPTHAYAVLNITEVQVLCCHQIDFLCVFYKTILNLA